MVDDDDPKVQAFVREIEKTFWLRFLVRSALTASAGYLATTIILPFALFLYGIGYGWASRPPAPQLMVKAPTALNRGCMEGKPAKVVNETYDTYVFRDNQSVITFQRGNEPTFICKFNDNALLYRNWWINEVVYHDGGERL
jgi:hypothetical protein